MAVPKLSAALQKRMKQSLATQGGDLGQELILLVERALEISTISLDNAVFTQETMQLNEGNTTASLGGSGFEYLGDNNEVVGYVRVEPADISLLELKAPAGFTQTLDMNADATFAMSANLSVTGTSIINQDVSITGAVVHASITLGATTLVSSILDEDDLGSDSATALATQQSIRAFIVSQIGANNELDEILANGNITGANDIIVTIGQKLTTDIIEQTVAGGAQINMSVANVTNITSDDNAQGESGLQVAPTFVAMFTDGFNGFIDITDSATLSSNYILNSTVAGQIILQVSNLVTGDQIFVSNNEILDKTANAATDVNGIAVGARNAVLKTAVTNSVALGGVGSIVKTDDTAYVQQLGFTETASIEGLLQKATLTVSSKTWTLPDATGTISLIGNAEDFSGVKTFSATPKTDAIDERTANAGITLDGVKLKDSTVIIGANQVLSAQAAAEADPSAITNYAAHASGAVAVTSNAATDLDTTAAAVATLENEVTALRASYVSLLAKIRTHGIIAT